MNAVRTVESVKAQLRCGALTVGEANVELVRIDRFRLISGRVPKQIRQALLKAVKAGRLGLMPREGLAPECFFNPDFAEEAHQARFEAACRGVKALAGVLA